MVNVLRKPVQFRESHPVNSHKPYYSLQKPFWVISSIPFEDHFQVSFLVSCFADLLVLHHLELLLIKVMDTLSSEGTYLRPALSL